MKPETTGIECPPGVEERRLPSVEAFGDGGELVLECHAGPDGGEAVAGGKVAEPASQARVRSGHGDEFSSGGWDGGQRGVHGLVPPLTATRRHPPTGLLGISHEDVVTRALEVDEIAVAAVRVECLRVHRLACLHEGDDLRPQRASCRPACLVDSRVQRQTGSISTGEMFSPPLMIMSSTAGDEQVAVGST